MTEADISTLFGIMKTARYHQPICCPPPLSWVQLVGSSQTDPREDLTNGCPGNKEGVESGHCQCFDHHSIPGKQSPHGFEEKETKAQGSVHARHNFPWQRQESPALGSWMVAGQCPPGQCHAADPLRVLWANQREESACKVASTLLSSRFVNS